MKLKWSVNRVDKRYQVFVSSTFIDFKEERKAIIQTLLNAKYIPAGMEMFSASNDEQFKYIKKIIDTCDYYILLIGARYGTINPVTGVSFTEQEYDYAVSKNVPVLVFLHDNPYNLPLEKRDDDKRELLEAFRAKVSMNRLCKMWNNMNDLVTSVIVSLIEETSENPQLGWTRGSSYDATELLSQINDLRLEKQNQQKEILKLRLSIIASSHKVENLACGREKYKLSGEIQQWSGSSYNYPFYETELTWDEIFSSIGPYLVSAKGYDSFKNELKKGINSSLKKDYYSLNENCVQTIKFQLNALGLINVNARESTAGGMMEFIGLSKKGNDYLLKIKTIKSSDKIIACV